MSGGTAVYCSRSHRRLWRQGEESRRVQRGRSLRALCTGDVLLLSIDQEGGTACHTGRESCFFYQLGEEYRVAVCSALTNSEEIYGK
jgi:phosphoribosyl-AMP cyclohydrolase